MINITTKQERLGYRSLHYSRRHREYGNKIYNWDIDHMEFDNNLDPVLMIEEKFGCPNLISIDLNTAEFTAKCKVANKLGIPLILLIVFPFNKENGYLLDGKESYDDLDHIQFAVIGVNELGRMKFKNLTRLTEAEWVKFLYKIRGIERPVLEGLGQEWRERWVPLVDGRRLI